MTGSTEGSIDHSPAAILADRYGTSARRSRGPLLALVVVVVLAFGGWLTWTIVDQADPAVASGDAPLKSLPPLRLADGRLMLGPFPLPNVQVPPLY